MLDMSIYAVTDRSWLEGRSLQEVVREVLQNGATMLQYREKSLSYEERRREALQLKEVAARYRVPLIIDDDVRLAEEIDADGVHIGQKDMPIHEARKLLGPDKIIGVTAPTVELAIAAQRAGADYIGAGAVFTTDTKKDTRPLSTKMLHDITRAVTIPVVAIGGINAENIDRLRGTGIAGVAVVSGIFEEKDPGEATKRLKNLFHRPRQRILPAALYIFDMDGTILDSMHKWTNLGRDYLRYKGITPPENLSDITDIMTMDESTAYFQKLGIQLSGEQIRREMLDLILEAYRSEVVTKPGMKELIGDLASDSENVLCVVTTSERKCVELAFRRLGILDFFDRIYSGQDMGLGKGTPEIYLEICKEYGIAPEDAVVFEDANFAVCSAKDAGCYVYGVLDPAYEKHWKMIRETADEILEETV